MAKKEPTTAEVLSLLSKFETEWTQFHSMWDQLTPSFQHLGAVVVRADALSQALPQMEEQFRKLGADLENRQRTVDAAKKEIADQVARYQDQLERELEPLKLEVKNTREKVVALQGTRADAERSFEERRFAQEATLKELQDRLAETQRKLDDIGRLTGAVR